MQNVHIVTDKTGRELIEHGSITYPIAAYDELFSMFALNEVSWHWHEEVEVVVVVKGSTKLHCLDSEIILTEGDGLFVNSNVMHRLTQVGDIDCRIINFVFKPSFLSDVDTVIYQKYIKPVTSNKTLNFLKLDQGFDWTKAAIEDVWMAFKSWNQSFGNELKVRNHLSDFWLKMITHTDHLTLRSEVSTQTKRLEEMMRYIQSHHFKSLTVADIASSANVSTSECFKLFKKILNTSPIEYMHSFRMKTAIERLTSTDETVTTIALDLGYNSHAYFSKRFKDVYGSTPSQYRKETKKPIE